MERSINKTLAEILQQINEIDSYFEAGQKRFDIYMSNTCLRRAIQMNIAIIGEATNRLLKEVPDLAITSAKKIISTRNYIIHGYDSLSHDIIWGIVVNHLPILAKEVKSLLDNCIDPSA